MATLLEIYSTSTTWSIVLVVISGFIIAILTPDLYPSNFRLYGRPVRYHVYMIYYPDRMPEIILWRLILMRGITMYFLILTCIITGYIVQGYLSNI